MANPLSQQPSPPCEPLWGHWARPHQRGQPQLQHRCRHVRRERELVRDTALPGDSGTRVRPGCDTSTGTPPLPRPHSASPPQPLPHLQGVVEEFAHAAEAAALPLVLPQPLQRVRDVPLLDGHVGAGLPEGLEDKRRQPGARDTSQGRGSARGSPGWQEEPWVQLQSPHQVLPLRSPFPKAL